MAKNSSSKRSIIFLSLLLALFFANKSLGKPPPSSSRNPNSSEYYFNRADTIGYIKGDSFSVPPYLTNAVNFWKKIYTLYSTKQSAIHDSQNLQVIYHIMDFSDLYARDDLDEKGKRKIREEKEEEMKKYYSGILSRLDKVDLMEITYKNLNDEEKRVYNLFSGVSESNRFYKAKRNLRSQVGQRNEFIRGIVDSGAFIDEMEEIFRSYRLPAELVRLTFVESMFNPKAYSKAHASGVWQFIPSTGRQYLRIDSLVDERNDPILATHAAARLLLTNYKHLNIWPLSVTAYNHGLFGIKRAVQKVGVGDLGYLIEHYKSRYWGFASRNFYAQFLAAVDVERNHRKYFGPLVRMEPVEYDQVRLPDHVSLSTLAEYCKIPEDELIDLNSGLTDLVINSIAFIPTDYDLKIPKGTKKDFLTRYANIPPDHRHSLQQVAHWHRVRSGEVLSKIAGRYGVSVGHLMNYNNLRSANRIYVGQLLKVPPKNLKNYPKSTYKPIEVARAPKVKVHYPKVKVVPLPEQSEPETPAETVVKEIIPSSPEEGPETNDSNSESISEEIDLSNLFSVLNPKNTDKPFALGTPPDLNPLTVSWQFHYQPKNPKATKDLPFAGKTTVIDGETPGHFSEWCRISTPQFRRLNRLRFGQSISLGQRVRLECLSTWEELHNERIAFHQNLQQEKMKECPEIDVRVHKIKANENLWDLSHKIYGTPIWLIQKYNPNMDLSNGIHKGERIKIPICKKVDLTSN